MPALQDSLAMLLKAVLMQTSSPGEGSGLSPGISALTSVLSCHLTIGATPWDIMKAAVSSL